MDQAANPGTLNLGVSAIELHLGRPVYVSTYHLLLHLPSDRHYHHHSSDSSHACLVIYLQHIYLAGKWLIDFPSHQEQTRHYIVITEERSCPKLRGALKNLFQEQVRSTINAEHSQVTNPLLDLHKTYLTYTSFASPYRKLTTMFPRIPSETSNFGP